MKFVHLDIEHLAWCFVNISMKTKCTLKTSESGNLFTVKIDLRRLTPNLQSHETAEILRAIALSIDNADFTVTRCSETHI